MGVETTRPSLFERLRGARDDAAWREFDARYGDLIRRYCLSWGLQHWDADDVHQIVLLSLARALERGFEYRPARGRFRSYLGRVVRNSILNYRACPRVDASVVDDEVLEAIARDGPAEVDATWEGEWRDHHLRRALERLRGTASRRDARILDRLLAGATTAEIATEFALSEQAVHKVKQRTRDLLRRLVLEQIREEDGRP